MSAAVVRWGIQWHSENALDGLSEYLLWDSPCRPLLFETRYEARKFARAKWGYIKSRPDLRAEPHGWRNPKAVRVCVLVTPCDLISLTPEEGV